MVKIFPVYLEMFGESGDLVTPAMGPNIRLTFEGLNLKHKSKALRTDLFWARPVSTEPETLDNSPMFSEAIWGLYSVWQLEKNQSVDFQ